MKAHVADELIDLSPTQKRELAEALIASAEAEQAGGDLSDAQRAELRTRLTHHRAHPDEAGLSFQDLKARLLATAA